MGCRILEDNESNEAAFYCSTTGWAFGPLFPSREAAERFLEIEPRDPRNLTDAELSSKFAEFINNYVCECGSVRYEEDDAEQKADAIAPEGCTCPNNGGGDCPWCEAKQIALDWEPEIGERFVCSYCEKSKAKGAA